MEKALVRRILVVKKKDLFGDSVPIGFLPEDRQGYLSIIHYHSLWMEREEAEKNSAFKQPIVYSVVANPVSKKIFLFRRANNEAYDEKRLRNKWSCGLGGHVDQAKDGDNSSPLLASVQRELFEELGIQTPASLNVQGYINQEDDVGSVHFGILNLVFVSQDEVIPRDPEIAEGKMVSLIEARTILTSKGNEAEGWTEICLPYLENFLS